jgi:hypothetical protein
MQRPPPGRTPKPVALLDVLVKASHSPRLSHFSGMGKPPSFHTQPHATKPRVITPGSDRGDHRDQLVEESGLEALEHKLEHRGHGLTAPHLSTRGIPHHVHAFMYVCLSLSGVVRFRVPNRRGYHWPARWLIAAEGMVSESTPLTPAPTSASATRGGSLPSSRRLCRYTGRSCAGEREACPTVPMTLSPSLGGKQY